MKFALLLSMQKNENEKQNKTKTKTRKKQTIFGELPAMTVGNADLNKTC